MDQETIWDDGEHICWPRSHSTRNYDSLAVLTRSKAAPIWMQLWKKIKKEKKKMLQCSNSMRFTYDPDSYSQNFDDGSIWTDPDDLSRSFSARFAVPSRIFEKNGLVV
ncbi:hypothetical protein F511_06110 [Dorcoceras hygrometricum]|uniref:Uncharacterized protein n=1 Tax=Dorcoceras hygrometricum TaxID=472368 RepID=A0A2Z7DAI0_9LAMI|nr:hypothetical protein F511_06110 [Dorcoceras hygrometricum]